MRTLQELINSEESAWPLVKDWIDQARNEVEILSVIDQRTADDALVNMQVATRSPMGAIIHNTGGILIDKGWLRILGSGNERMQRSLPSWNLGKTLEIYGGLVSYLLVADDAVGGFYAINGGALGKDVGNMYYNAPDMTDWMPMNMSYTQFLLFCFETDMNDFYSSLRWSEYEREMQNLQPDYAFSFYPFLWTEEGADISITSRKVMPVEEIYRINMESKSSIQ